MMRQITLLGFLTAVLANVASVPASTFFSGRIDVDATAAGGKLKTGVKQLGLLGAGIGYHNEWTAGTGGLAGVGNKVAALGVAPISTARIGNSLHSLGTGLNLVAVYALEGVTATNHGQAKVHSNFNPTMSVPGGSLPNSLAGGVVRIYDRTDAATGKSVGFDSTNPSTWLQNLANPMQGLLAEFAIVERADSYRQGVPKGSATTIPVVLESEAVNTTPMDVTGALLAAVADFLLQLRPSDADGGTDGGTLLSNANITGDVDMLAMSPLDLLLRIEQTPQSPGAQSIPDDSELTLLDQLFDALLDSIVAGDHRFADTAQAGNNFDIAQNFASGDFSVENTGGTAVPGRRFQIIQGPEPTAILAWAVVGAIGLGLSSRRRRH